MAFFTRLFGQRDEREALIPLYRSIVAHGRDREWYARGQVPDTKDGRFDMVAAILALVLLRLETEGETFAAESAWLAELFVDDMDAQLRELGIGDIVVGKHIGKMMGALGGRVSAYRDGFGAKGDGRDAVRRNLYRGEAPDDDALDYTLGRLEQFSMALAATSGADIIDGRLPDLT